MISSEIPQEDSLWDFAIYHSQMFRGSFRNFSQASCMDSFRNPSLGYFSEPFEIFSVILPGILLRTSSWDSFKDFLRVSFRDFSFISLKYSSWDFFRDYTRILSAPGIAAEISTRFPPGFLRILFHVSVTSYNLLGDNMQQLYSGGMSLCNFVQFWWVQQYVDKLFFYSLRCSFWEFSVFFSWNSTICIFSSLGILQQLLWNLH